MENAGQTVVSHAPKWLARLASFLRFAAALSVLLLASRQGLSCLWSAHSDWPVPGLLFAGSFLLACYFPVECIVGAVALAPTLNGLDRIGVLGTTPGVSLVLSGVLIGAVPRIWKGDGGLATWV